MSSYENAPATQLLSTSCACCGRPLLDAVSVEAGVGPDCREKYGYGQAEGAPDWARAARLLGELGEPLASVWELDAHKAANVLVRAIAGSTGDQARRAAGVAAVDALGFGKLAAKLLTRAGGILVEDAGAGLLRVKAPFSEQFNEAIRRVPGARWIKAEKVRTVPADSRVELWAAFKIAFPAGTLISGPKGLTVL
jgi:uncharacterized protein DUF6011